MVESEVLTSGMVGQRVRFEFSGHWHNLLKTAVFRAGDVTRLVADVETEAEIPAEVLAKAGGRLTVGIYGVAPDGSLVIPTIYADGPCILPGVEPDGKPGTEPDLPVWAQMQAMMGSLNTLATDARENLVAAINEVCRDTKTQLADGLKAELFSGLVVPSSTRKLAFALNAGTNEVTVTLGSSMNVYYIQEGDLHNQYVTPDPLTLTVPNNAWLVYDITDGKFTTMTVGQINASDHRLLGCFCNQYTAVKGPWLTYYLESAFSDLEQACDVSRNGLGDLNTLVTKEKTNLVAALNEQVGTTRKMSLMAGLVVPSGARSIGFSVNASSNEVTVTLGSSMNAYYIADNVVYSAYVNPASVTLTVPNNAWLVFNATTKTFAAMTVGQINSSSDQLIGCFANQYTAIKGPWLAYYLESKVSECNNSIGALTSLVTKEKSSLVAAVNEQVGTTRKMSLMAGLVVPSSTRSLGFSLNTSTNEVTVTLGSSMNAYYVADNVVYSAYVTPNPVTMVVPNNAWLVFNATTKTFAVMTLGQINASADQLIGCFANQYTSIKGPWLTYYLENRLATLKTQGNWTTVVSQDGSGDHTTIQAAVQAASDGDTILVMPGTYVEQVDAWGKTVHLVGLNRETCILMDHSSHYETPPLKISAGSVQNMTIIEDHASPASSLLYGDDTDGRAWDLERAYSIHVEDYLASGKDLLIANCKIRNTKRAALGMGTYKGQHITVRDCEIWSGTPTRTADVKRGAVYFHNYSLTGVKDAPDQRVTLIHNDISCDDNIAMCILDARAEGIASYLTVEAVGNCVYSAGSGMTNAAVEQKGSALTGSYVTLSPKSWGNSVALLNAVL